MRMWRPSAVMRFGNCCARTTGCPLMPEASELMILRPAAISSGARRPHIDPSDLDPPLDREESEQVHGYASRQRHTIACVMADLHLSFAMTPYDRVLPLITGEVKPAGITLDYQGMPGAVPGVFYDQLKYGRYDVSEMSFSSTLVDRAKGWPYRLLPVFHNRNFSYTSIVIRQSSGIRV